MVGGATPVDAAAPVSIETKVGFCSMCMEEEELLLAPCGHGFCRADWQGYVATAIIDGSTTTVNKGGEDLLDVTRLQCPACASENKCALHPSPAVFL